MSVLSSDQVNKVCKKIASDYPDYRNVQPKLTAQSDGNTLLTFEKKVKTEDGVEMKLILRATVDAAGKILKVSASR